MAGIESVLPYDDTLECEIDQFAEVIRQEIEAIRETSLFGDVIDWTLIQNNTEEMSDKLAAMIGFHSEAESESLIRGMLFGRQLLAIVYGQSNNGIRFPEYFLFDWESIDKTRERIITDTQEYLGARPRVDAFIREYMALLDEGRTFPHSVETACALVLMSGEIWRAEQYIRKSAENADPDMFTNVAGNNED